MPLDAQAKPEIWHSVCPHDCPSTCALEVEKISPTEIGRVHGAKGNGYTAGVICAKVARYAERVHHPDRLKTPLRRVGGKGVGIEAFEPISWDDALDEVAEAFLQAEQRFGPEAVWPYYYAGTMGLVNRDGIHRLRHAKRYSGMLDTICVTLGQVGWSAGTGAARGVDPREMAKADLVVVWGGNPVNTQVNVMTHISRARKERGAKLVVVDPYRTGTAQQADIHLCLNPGSDGALAAAVAHVLLREGLEDRAYLDRLTDWDAAVEDHYRTCSPQWAAGITGLSVQEIEDFARLYGTTERSFIRCGYGFSRSRNGSVAMHAVSCLPSLIGAWQYEGGGAAFRQAEIYPLDRRLIDGSELRDGSVRMLDQCRIGAVLTGDKTDLGDGPPVTALLIQNTNPLVVCPESGLVRDGFGRDDLFTCVHEQFMTDTAAVADIVLPATTFLEHDDIYTASGHTHLQVAKAVIEPLAEARSNHEVICALAKRLGAEHPGFDMSIWEIIDKTLVASGLPDAETLYAKHWHDCALDFESMHFLNGFGHADGRFRFKPDWTTRAYVDTPLPDMPGYSDNIEKADAEHPFRLVTAPARGYLNTSFTETPGSQKREGRPTVKLHPDAAARLAIADGQRVRIGNKRGSLVIHAEIFDGLQPGTLVAESIWPNTAFEEGIGINLLVGADPGAPKRGGVFHDTAVWLVPA